jgi:hypothetical protein
VKDAVATLPAVACSGRGDRAGPNPAAGLAVLIASLAVHETVVTPIGNALPE